MPSTCFRARIDVLTKIFIDTTSASETRGLLSWGIGDDLITVRKLRVSDGIFLPKTASAKIVMTKNQQPVSGATVSERLEELIVEAQNYS